MVNRLVSLLLRIIFYRGTSLRFSDEEVVEYERIYAEALETNGELIDENRFPKYRLIQYISETKPVILHGSNHRSICKFEPKRQTLFNGHYADAVFGTKDGIWSVFYAVFDRSKLKDNFRNTCLLVRNDKRKYYYFSLTPNTLKNKPWMNGTVYFLPQESFEQVSGKFLAFAFDEWSSKTPVKPVAKIQVSPQDFYYLHKVSCHKATESMVTSWFLYKLRIKLFGRREKGRTK